MDFLYNFVNFENTKVNRIIEDNFGTARVKLQFR